MFEFVSVMFPVVFLLVFGIIIFTIIKGIKEWDRNNKSPILTVEAKVIDKRTDISTHYHSGADNNMSIPMSSTTYYVTFEVESKDRLEFRISGKEYGQLTKGDFGKLTFQGTRYKKFDRNN